MKMTPSFQWVCLLAMVGCAVSIPAPLTDDACALLCYPRSFPKGVCEFRGIQSGSVLDQARIVISRCLKCDHQQSFNVEVSCHALISLLGSLRGCRCSLSYPVPTNAKIPSLVNKLAEDVVLAISSLSPSLEGRLIRTLQATFWNNARLGVEATNLVDDGRSDRLEHDAEDVKLDRGDIEQPPMDLDDQDAELPKGDPELPEGDPENVTSPSDSSEESTVDWEKWCMSQCYNGHGGNACRCDLIP